MAEKEKKNSVSYKALMVSSIISTIFGIVGALSIAFLTSKTPSLQYDILPVSYFKRDSVQLSIVNIKILNSGKKECEDVAVNVDFGLKITANDYSIQKSSESIAMIQKFDSTNGSISYSIPYLNPNEQIVYSFLLKKVIDEKNIQVDLRGKGITGIKSDLNKEIIPNILLLFTLGMFVMAITLVSAVVFHQRRVIKFNLHLQSLEDEKMRLYSATIDELKKQLEEKSAD